jgi:hypothetical protein
MNQGVPVAILLRDLAESRGIDLELLAGGGGLDRRITNPHPQNTGLALSGFDKYLREGRVFVLGESEVRFLESLTPGERTAVIRRVFAHALPCLVVPPAQPPRKSWSRPTARRCRHADPRRHAGDGAVVRRARHHPPRAPSSTACSWTSSASGC